MNGFSHARLARAALAAAALAAVTFVAAGSVLASHVTVEPSFPDGMTLGQTVEIPVAVHDPAGLPLPGTTLLFTETASFSGVSGEVVIGRAVTDEEGIAWLVFRPRSTGRHEIRVEYLLPGEDVPEVFTTAVEVAGDAQLYRSSPGVEVPVFDAWLLMALLSTVWGILLGVALRLVAIARAGGAAAIPAPGRGG